MAALKLLRSAARFSIASSPRRSIYTISACQKLPDSTLAFFDAAGELRTVSVSDLTMGKRSVLFAVPGAFTPTCSQAHVPGFAAKAGELRAKGVTLIACISVNDAFVMRAWKESLGVGDDVMMLSDGNGDFTRAIGAELDLRDNPAKLGVRSRRYAMLVDDRVVKVLSMEEGEELDLSGTYGILRAL